MYKYLTVIISAIFLGIASIAATSPFDLKFPIEELGNCGSVSECKTYCDKPANIDACVSFGEKNGLIGKEEVKEAKKYIQTIKTGDWPLADCDDPQECRQKCELPKNRNACFKWAKEKGFIDDNVVIEPKGPKEPEIDKQKASTAIESDGGPGGCGSFESCSKFCSNPDNQQTCFAYGEKHGLFAREETEKIRKLMNQTGPGGCKGEECRKYCEDSSHHEECFKFAKENGLISEDEAQRIEKFRSAKESISTFGGPGGCKNEEECRNFCSNPENSQTCIEFARKAGFIHEERAEENFRRIEKYKEHFEEFKKYENTQPGDYDRQGPPPVFHQGPGGCSSPEECIKFCSEPEHRSECAQFGPKAGGPPPGGTFQDAEQYRRCEEARQSQSEEAIHKFCNFSQPQPPIYPSGSMQPYPTKNICPLMPEHECSEGYYKKYHTTQDGCGFSECVKSDQVYPPYPSHSPYPSADYIPTACPSNYYWDGKICVSSQTNSDTVRDPAADCSKYGGTWTGSYCQMPNQSDPATECTKSGGSWDGSRCVFATPPPTSEPVSLIEHSFLGAAIRFLLR